MSVISMAYKRRGAPWGQLMMLTALRDRASAEKEQSSEASPMIYRRSLRNLVHSSGAQQRLPMARSYCIDPSASDASLTHIDYRVSVVASNGRGRAKALARRDFETPSREWFAVFEHSSVHSDALVMKA